MKSIVSLAALTLIAVPALAADKDWNYADGTTPERWSTVNAAYALCDAGLNQSPIDLGAANARGSIALETNYTDTAGTLKIAKEKVQVNFPEGMEMISGGKPFGLIQVHFHTPSEHTIDGEHFPLVGHFVHATKDGELGVLGIMFREGAANPALEAVVENLEQGSGANLAFDAEDLLPKKLSVYRYMGSLTTPPCSEGVNWHVAQEPVTASREQIAAFAKVLGPSARSLQPLGTRLLVAPAE